MLIYVSASVQAYLQSAWTQCFLYEKVLKFHCLSYYLKNKKAGPEFWTG